MTKALIILLLISINSHAGESSAKPIDPIQVMYEKCMSLMKDKAFEPAKTCLEEIVDISPASVNALFYLGQMYAQAKQYNESITTYKQLLQLQPNDFWAIGRLIDVLRFSNNNDEALKLAEDANRRFPNFPKFKVALINEYHKIGKSESIETLRKELFSLTSRKIFDGLQNENLYVRESFTVNNLTVNAIEYFPTENYTRPKITFMVRFPDENVRRYRVHFDEVATSLVSRDEGKKVEVYWVDAFDGTDEKINKQSSVTSFNGEPTYEAMRAVVVKDLTEGRKSFSYCLDPITKKPVACRDN